MKNSIKTLYVVHEDGIYSYISKELVSADCEQYLHDFPHNYFRTFSAAKRTLLRRMDGIRQDWSNAVKNLRAVTEGDIIEE